MPFLFTVRNISDKLLSMNKLYILITLVFSLQLVTFAQILTEFDKVKEIKLLESNREDVRNIFKNYDLIKSDDTQHYEQFSTEKTKIEVLYSDGKCDKNYLDFDVSEWKVVGVHLIITNGRIKPDEIGIDLSSFKRSRAYEYYAYNDDSGLALIYIQGRVQEIYFVPSKQSFSLLCPNNKINENASILNYLRQLKTQKQFRLLGEIAHIKDLILEKSEIQRNCNLRNQDTQSPTIIKILAKETNPFKDELSFNYTVSGGKVIGTGTEVLWDLSGVKAGNYTITAAVDDGCGFCGATKTKTVTVKENKDCNN